ncbi:DNA primase family protein [Bacillus rhizoplanae]|uniref:DNA primase family protein n=1 Tax=Bacillus rhizoplanae TaxID=2880966 RepID=UPI003D1D4452
MGKKWKAKKPNGLLDMSNFIDDDIEEENSTPYYKETSFRVDIDIESKKDNEQMTNTEYHTSPIRIIRKNSIDIEHDETEFNLQQPEFGTIPTQIIQEHSIDRGFESLEATVMKMANVEKQEFSRSREEASIEQQDQRKSKNIEYDIYTELLVRDHFKCFRGQLFVYNKNTGCFFELDDTTLRTLVRSNWPPSIERLLSKGKVDDIIDRLKSCNEIQISDRDFDVYPHLINFRDCVLDIETGQILPHSPNYCFKSYVNANYRSERSEGKTFLKFINQCTNGDLEKIELLQQCMGYLLSYYTTAKKWFVFIGQPNTGKSTLLDVITEIVGGEYTSAVSLHQLNQRFMTAELFNVRLNISGELNEGELKDIDVLKKITGNDVLMGERKGKDPFFFTNKCKLLFAGNQMPSLRKLDSTTAFIDRIVFVVFNNTIPKQERDYGLKDKLLNERDFIVRWAIEGGKRLVKNNFVFPDCEDSIQFKNQYVKEINNVSEFVRDLCVLEPYDKNIRVHKKDLFNAYLKYCKDNCSKVLSKSEFFQEICKLNVEPKKFRLNGSNPLEGYEGLALLSQLNINDRIPDNRLEFWKE